MFCLHLANPIPLPLQLNKEVSELESLVEAKVSWPALLFVLMVFTRPIDLLGGM